MEEVGVSGSPTASGEMATLVTSTLMHGIPIRMQDWSRHQLFGHRLAPRESFRRPARKISG